MRSSPTKDNANFVFHFIEYIILCFNKFEPECSVNLSSYQYFNMFPHVYVQELSQTEETVSNSK